MMPPLKLLIKFVLLLIIFQASFSVNLLVANWQLSPEFWSPNIFPLTMATKMVAAWSAVTVIKIPSKKLVKRPFPSFDCPNNFHTPIGEWVYANFEHSQYILATNKS